MTAQEKKLKTISQLIILYIKETYEKDSLLMGLIGEYETLSEQYWPSMEQVSRIKEVMKKVDETIKVETTDLNVNPVVLGSREASKIEKEKDTEENDK